MRMKTERKPEIAEAGLYNCLMLAWPVEEHKIRAAHKNIEKRVDPVSCLSVLSAQQTLLRREYSIEHCIRCLCPALVSFMVDCRTLMH